MPEMTPTPESSNVVSIGYDPMSSEVWVEFNSGTYVYMEVPEFIWEQFRDSDSKGSFVHSHLKPGYGVRRP
jgi:hypothetical protein